MAGRCALSSGLQALQQKVKGQILKKGRGFTACQKVANLANLTSAANLNRLRMSSECWRGNLPGNTSKGVRKTAFVPPVCGQAVL